MTYALALYQSLERSDPATAMTKFRSSATVERDVKAFKEQLASVKTTEELFKNRRLMGFVLTAYGLETELNYMGRIKGVLMSDLSKPTSVANILKDRRYREIAGDLQMFKTGLDLLKNPATTEKVVDRYVAAQYELSISKENPALREAQQDLAAALFPDGVQAFDLTAALGEDYASVQDYLDAKQMQADYADLLAEVQ